MSAVANSPASPANCYPFGGGSGGWDKFFIASYQNLPAANIVPGDILAFDLGSTSIYPPAFNSIAFAPSTTHAFVTVVSNSASIGNSVGDTTIGNFELQFTITSSFSFAGGGLLIRIENGGNVASANGFLNDGSCPQVIGGGLSSDSSK